MVSSIVFSLRVAGIALIPSLRCQKTDFGLKPLMPPSGVNN